MRDIAWFEPGTVDEAVALLQSHGPGARLIAGGTEVVVKMKDGALSPACLIDLTRIAGLAGIAEQAGWLRIGPTTTFSDLRRSPLIRQHYPALYEAAGKIGGRQVQNLGTLGGNICNAEPCADAATACLSLHAWTVLRGPGGERRLPLETVFQAPGQTSLAPGEILTDVLLPLPAGRAGGAYEKLALRKAMDQSLVGAAASLVLGDDSRCEEAGIGLATVAPHPLRACEAEGLLQGQTLTPERIRAAADRAAREARPRDSRKASAAYRRLAVAALVERALTRAWHAALQPAAS